MRQPLTEARLGKSGERVNRDIAILALKARPRGRLQRIAYLLDGIAATRHDMAT